MTTNNPETVSESDPLKDGDATPSKIFIAMQRYAIDDAYERNDRHIFVLESPHLHEMMYRRMLAGDSGVAFSRYLSGNNNERVPFGLFSIAPWPPKPGVLQGIGAINACSFPMQADTYGPARSSLPGLDRAVKALGRLRVRPESKSTDVWKRKFERLILCALAKRISPLAAAGATFYPCGEVARVLLNRVKPFIPDVAIQIWDEEKIPHPSLKFKSKSEESSRIWRKLRQILHEGA